MEKIGDIIGKVMPAIKQGQLQTHVRAASSNERVTRDIESLWCRIVDEDLRAHSYVEYIRNSTLYVKVDSSCYLSALKMKSGDVIAGLRDAGISVKTIRFRM